MRIVTQNGVFTDLFIERGSDMTIPDNWDGTWDDLVEMDASGKIIWDWNTVLYCDFQKHDSRFPAGSTEMDPELVSEIRIKRKTSDDHKWRTIYVKEISEPDDFTFSFYDNANASNTSYDYMIVPVVSDAEVSFQTVTVESDFEDFFLLDNDQEFRLILNANDELTYNQETSTQTTFGRKFPFVIKNGNVGYYSGTLTATFVELVDCEWKTLEGFMYRQNVMEFLADGKPKILKDQFGHIFIVSVVDSISEDSSDSPYFPKTQINWVEIGDATSIGDLYDNNFINTDMDRS